MRYEANYLYRTKEKAFFVGLYRYSRNAMYVRVLLILFGWAAAFASFGFLGYGALVAIAFHLRVIYGEEPWLAPKAWCQMAGICESSTTLASAFGEMRPTPSLGAHCTVATRGCETGADPKVISSAIV